VIGALAAALWGLSQASSTAEGSQPGLEVQSVQSSQPTSRKDAVLVFGASGRLGKQVVAEVMMMSFCHPNIITKLLITFASISTSIVIAGAKSVRLTTDFAVHADFMNTFCTAACWGRKTCGCHVSQSRQAGAGICRRNSQGTWSLVF